MYNVIGFEQNNARILMHTPNACVDIELNNNTFDLLSFNYVVDNKWRGLKLLFTKDELYLDMHQHDLFISHKLDGVKPFHDSLKQSLSAIVEDFVKQAGARQGRPLFSAKFLAQCEEDLIRRLSIIVEDVFITNATLLNEQDFDLIFKKITAAFKSQALKISDKVNSSLTSVKDCQFLFLKNVKNQDLSTANTTKSLELPLTITASPSSPR